MKRTKIVCTIGPASARVSTLVQMMKAGMNVCRLNFSHGSYADHTRLIRAIRAAAKKVGHPIAILQDLSGPKIRVGDLGEQGMKLVKGENVVLSCDLKPRKGTIPVQLLTLSRDLKPSDRVLFDDGLLEVEVQRIERKEIICRVVVPGLLKSHKGLNVPSAKLSVDTITPKDKKDLAFGMQQGVDIVSLSFVRSAADVRQLKRLIKRHLPKGATMPLVNAKIEMHQAVDAFDEILLEVDAVMVARGDLALEIDSAQVPVLQKTIIKKALDKNRAVIVATEMLGSMVNNPRPTRAEISDVANAVIDHTDATMLSGESATGKYPVQAVRTMAHIIEETEASSFDDYIFDPQRAVALPHHEELSAVSSLLARVSKISGILVMRSAAHLAPLIRRFRPELPIVVSTIDAAAARRLQLYWGVIPRVLPAKNEERTLRQLLAKARLCKKGSTVVVFEAAKNQMEVREITL